MSRERVIDWKKIQNIEWKNFYSASFVRIKNRILYRNISASKKKKFLLYVGILFGKQNATGRGASVAARGPQVTSDIVD